MTRIRLDRRGPRHTIVDERVYARHGLSIAGRHVLGWMLGRSDDYEIRVSVVRRVHGLSEGTWRRVRDELKRDGWLTQEKRRGEDGRWEWEMLLTDAPLSTIRRNQGMDHPPESMDGKSMPGKQGDNYHEVDLHEVDSHEPPPPSPLPAAQGEEEVRIEGLNGKDSRLVQQVAARAGVEPQRLADELLGRRAAVGAGPINNLLAWLERTAAALAQGREMFRDAGERWRASRRQTAAQPRQEAQPFVRGDGEAARRFKEGSWKTQGGAAGG